jgi:biotin carboxylase
LCRIDDITLHSLLEIVEDESEHSKLGVVVVDPFSTGASLAAHLYKHKYKVIAVYSANMEQLSTMKNLIPQGIDLVFESIVAFDDGIDGVSEKLMKLDFSIVAVMAGAETGVELADRLSSHLGLRTNGVQLSEARRNKYVMGETIRRAGIRAVKQLKATTWGQVEQFLDEWKPDPFQVVLKPVESAGSEDVILCRNLTEVQVAFGRIIGKVNGLGLLNKEVLVQEYLEGQEYVVDMVSRDGVHKVVAIWECDKRAVNGADFVLHGYIPTIVSAEAHEQLVTYQKRVLTALGILNGPSHGELKWCRGEPVLVEVGARCHGGEGTWVDVANNVYGCNQVTTTAAVYLDHQEFDLLPPQVNSTSLPLFLSHLSLNPLASHSRLITSIKEDYCVLCAK